MSSDVRIGKWLAVPMLTVFVLLALVAGVGISSVRRESALARSIVTEDAALAAAASDARAHVLGMRRFEKDCFLNIADAKKRAEYVTKWEQERSATESALDRLRSLASDTVDRSAALEMGRNLDAYSSGVRRVIASIEAHEIATPAAANVAVGVYKAATHALEDAAIAEADRKAGTMKTQVARIDAEADAGSRFMEAATLAALLLGAGASLFIVRSITTPLRAASAAIGALAAGNLQMPPLDMTGRDEMARLGRAVNEVAERFRALVQLSAETSAQVGAAADALLETARTQAKGSASQSESIEQMTATLDGTRSSFAEVSASAGQVLCNAEETHKHSAQLASHVGELAKRTQRISEISEAIRDFASRSELLALNASLEGTRAGEAGKGFAVVAGQMQTLSEKVTGQVLAIKEIAGEIEGATTAAVDATAQSAALSRATTAAAQAIAESIGHEMMALDSAVTGSTEISDVARQNAARGREIVTAAEQLKHQAASLEAAIATYRAARTQ